MGGVPDHREHFIKVFAGAIAFALLLTILGVGGKPPDSDVDDTKPQEPTPRDGFSFAGVVVLALMGFATILAVQHSKGLEKNIEFLRTGVSGPGPRPTFISAPKHAIRWRREFQGDNNKKFDKFLDPRQTKKRKLRYFEPGAQALGMAAMVMPKNVKLSDGSFAKEGLDPYSRAKQSELARRANEEAERLGFTDEYVAAQPPPTVIHHYHQAQSQRHPPPTYSSLNRIDTGSPVLIWFGLAFIWSLSLNLFSSKMSDMEVTATQLAGTALLSLLLFFFTTEAQVDLPVSIGISFLSAILLYALSAAFVGERKRNILPTR